jgi:hypothetical protein
MNTKDISRPLDDYWYLQLFQIYHVPRYKYYATRLTTDPGHACTKTTGNCVEILLPALEHLHATWIEAGIHWWGRRHNGGDIQQGGVFAEHQRLLYSGWRKRVFAC